MVATYGRVPAWRRALRSAMEPNLVVEFYSR